MAGGAPSHNGSKLAERLQNTRQGIPKARMLDYGVTREDAETLFAVTTQEWWDVAKALGERHEQLAQEHGIEGRPASAVLERERAAAVFNIGQLAINRDDDIKRSLYRRSSKCLEDNVSQPGCDYSRLVLPANDGATLYGWHFAVADPIGHVVMFGGLNGWGSSFMRHARVLVRAGLEVTLAEAPGQGETRMRSGLYLSRDGLSQAKPFLDHARAGGKPVGLVGFSFGGLISTHLAAMNPDMVALCTNGSPVAIKSFDHPVENELFGAAFGAEGPELRERVSDFAYESAAHPVSCPILSLEGGADPLVPPGTWRGFAGDAHPQAHAVFWEDGLHTLYNHAAERDALIAAWVSDRFRQKKDS